MDKSVDTDIQAFDADDHMVAISRENARLAGVEKLIHFQKRDVAQLSHPKKYGFIITNPPYGERLENKESLQELYRVLGERYRALDCFSMYLITSYEKAEEAMKTYYYQYLGPKPPKKTVRMQ